MPARNILLIVDMQKGFITDESEHLVTSINKIQHDFEQVIFTKFYNPDPSPFRDILDYQKLAPDTEDTKLAVMPRADAFIINRPHYTCLIQPLKAYLEKLNAKEVYVCGVATEACVLKSVLDLFESSIRTWVIKDLCASDQDAHYHEIALELLAKLIGKQHIIHSSAL